MTEEMVSNPLTHCEGTIGVFNRPADRCRGVAVQPIYEHLGTEGP
ncbi:hypothetical protein [Nocardia terpenica]|nr:hypothetical protein [Nocardia terpenica]